MLDCFSPTIHLSLGSKYKDGLFRVILTPDGKGVVPESNRAIPVAGDLTLSVTQAPDGSLIDARYAVGDLIYYKPTEAPPSALVVKGVFPRRGGQAGGSMLSVYGVNLNKGTTTTVLVGGRSCPVQSASSKKVVCKLPGGSGTVDVVVSSGTETSTFKAGYRFISGIPA